MIVTRSRYTTAEIIGIQSSDGSTRFWVGNRAVLDPDRDLGRSPSALQSRADELLDSIALRHFGAERLWWALADLNLSELGDFTTLVETMLELPTGTTLLAPSREDARGL